MGIDLNDDLNMPDTVGRIFKALFDDESWTWKGLARLLVQRYNEADLDELKNCIDLEIEEEGIML